MIDPSQSPPGIACRAFDRDSCRESLVVLEAVGIDSEILAFDEEFLLIVRPEDEFEARRQLDLYHLENQEKEKVTFVFPPLSRGLHSVLIYIAILILIDGFLKGSSSNINLLEAGSANAELICQGEWWRAVTALTLHADIVHLGGNIVFGALFALFACQILGPGIAWLSILLAGAGGNILSAYLQADSHTSIGASTAVFAALAIQASYTCVFWNRLSESRRRRWSPLIGGIVLLTFLGGPGPKIDVLSHVTGFVAGLMVGTTFGLAGQRFIGSRPWQLFSGLLALFIVAFSWFHAAGTVL